MRGSAPARGKLVSLGLVLAALYFLPIANFILFPLLSPLPVGFSWREVWSPVFPKAPGLLLVGLVESLTNFGVILRRMRFSQVDAIQSVLASLAAAAEVYGLTRLAGQTRGRRVIAVMIGLLASVAGTFFLTLTLTLPT